MIAIANTIIIFLLIIMVADIIYNKFLYKAQFVIYYGRWVIAKGFAVNSDKFNVRHIGGWIYILDKKSESSNSL